MRKFTATSSRGFSMLELLLAMTISLIFMAAATTLLSGAFLIRSRETRRTDAMVDAQIALNLMSRELANSGYGLTDNGIVLADSGSQQLHFRANVQNTDAKTDDSGEDVTYLYDPNLKAIVRYDRFGKAQNSILVNNAESLTFQYFDYTGTGTTPTISSVPSVNTGRIRISLVVKLGALQGQTTEPTYTVTSDIALRNSKFMLLQQ